MERGCDKRERENNRKKKFGPNSTEDDEYLSSYLDRRVVSTIIRAAIIASPKGDF